MRTLCLVLASLLAPLAHAATLPVHWEIPNAPRKPVKPGSTLSLTLVGHIDPGWHLYALEEPEGGPNATVIGLAEGDQAELLSATEGKPKLVMDPQFGMTTGFFENTATFTLQVRPAAAEPVHVLVRYQSCNDKVCLPPHTDTVELPIAIGK